MIVDVNAFIGKWPYWPLRSTAPEEVSAELAAWNIDRAAICSTRGVFVHCEDGNREVEEAVRRDPRRFIGFACLGPARFDLDACAARGFRGVRLYPQHHSYHPLYEPSVDQVCEWAGARGWPVLLPLRLIMNWGMPVIELEWIVRLVERHPRTTWILAGINYLGELSVAIWLMRRFETVHLETSCVMGYQAVARLVEECGDSRILFGSGAPIQHGGAGVEKVLHARISDAAREAIFSGNAARLLRL